MLNRKHRITKQLIHVFLVNDFKDTVIYEITRYNHMIRLVIKIPVHKEMSNLLDLLPNIQQELNATDHKIEKQHGKIVSIAFGLNNLDNITFNNEYISSGTLKIKMPSSFGYSYLDFADGASCHLLNGGTTRMGKTVFLLYTATMLFIQTNGEIDLHITSTKLKDFYPFINVPNVSLSRTESELLTTLDSLIDEYKRRDTLLYSDTFAKATDAKSVKELYPQYYFLFRPIFLIIDEYARFSGLEPMQKEIQKKIMELVESAGYVNIHLIISTQRPDARTVLHPRVKANLLARICFTTADKNNSLIILDREGAENLGKIKGRALFLDSDMTMVQIPKFETTDSEELLQPYKKEIEQHDEHNNETDEGSVNNGLSDKISNMFKESTSDFDLQQEQQSGQRGESGNEASINGWYRLASTENKG